MPAGTSYSLLKSRCFKEKKLKLWGDCATLLQNILKRQERHPVKSVVVIKVSCLTPVIMAKQSEISVAKFESIGNKLFQVDLFTVKETDEAKIKYDDFLKFVVLKIFQV